MALRFLKEDLGESVKGLNPRCHSAPGANGRTKCLSVGEERLTATTKLEKASKPTFLSHDKNIGF